MDTEPIDRAPTIPEPAVPETQSPPIHQTKGTLMMWFVALGVIVGGVLLLSMFRSSIIPTKPALPEATIAPLPSPTPIRNVSAIATQSAFISLEQHAASVSSAIANTNLDDPSLSPPSIDLPLGFIQ